MSNAVYFDQIKQLVELQKVDDAIHAVKQDLSRAPSELDSLEQRFAAIETQRNYILDKLSHLQDQQKRLSLEIDDDSARIKKSKNKLMMVENTKEYHAMMREMDTMEKMNRMREEERSNLLADLSDLEGRKDALQKDIDALSETISAQQANLDQELAEKRARLAELDKDKKKASEAVPAPILTRYNFIRDRIPNPVIVPVSEGVCKGCHVVIPPQTFIDLQKGEQILSCPNCLRIIFWERHFSGNE